MRIHIPKYEPNRPGGGWTFCRNLVNELGWSEYEDSDIYFIAGASMVERSEVEKAKADGKKIVLRVDNALRNSRNRGTGMTRMRDFAQLADLLVYQSEWARDYLKPYLGVDGPVIVNGVDTKVFHKGGQKQNVYIYSRFNRDETKNWEIARYWYSRKQIEDPNAVLWIIGAFSPELIEYNFDFYNNENFKYWGVIQSPETLADLLRSSKYFIYTYFADACSNSLIEAIRCGCKIIDPHHFLDTGGAPDILQTEDLSSERMAREYLEEFNKL